MIYIKLFITFAQIGIFGFGGGMAMLPVIYQSAQTFDLMSQDEFSGLVAISQVTPGPIAVNAATYVGYNCAGFPGAAAATFGVGLPSFILVSIVYHFVNKCRNSRIVDGAFEGVRPVVTGLFLSAAVFLGKNVFATGSVVTLLIFVVSTILMARKKVSPIYIIIGAGVVGAAAGGLI